MTVSPASGRPPAHLPSLRIHAGDAAAWTRKNGPLIGSNALAGLVASLLTIAYCLSFSALLFQGQLGSGLGPGLWALLVGSAIAGLYVSLTTSLPPAEAGPGQPGRCRSLGVGGNRLGPGLRRRRRRGAGRRLRPSLFHRSRRWSRALSSICSDGSSSASTCDSSPTRSSAAFSPRPGGF